MVIRAPRPLTSTFAPTALAQQLSDLAKLRHPGFEWDGSAYQASKRSDLGDTEGLARHIVPLSILLKMCSTGFPSHPNLRQALTILQARHHIFKECSNVFKVASNAADQWRLMCRHIYNRRREGSTEVYLTPLVDLIVLPSNPSAAEVPPQTPKAEEPTSEEEVAPSTDTTAQEPTTALVPINHTEPFSMDWVTNLFQMRIG